MAVARTFVIALALVLGAALTALALEFPALSGRVVDDAGILDAATRAALTQKLADLETKSTDQLVVVTLKSLQGTSIEQFGVELARHWKIGQKDKNNGVLLIVVPSERKVRIEVGYGLEGTLTDAISRLIIANAITPRFRANDFPGGISRGVDDIVSVLTGDAEEWKRRAAPRRPNPAPTWDPFMVLFLLFFAFVLVYIIMGAVYGGRNKRHRWSDDFVWSTAPGTSWTPDTSGGGFSGGGDFSGGGGGGFSGGGGDFGGGGASGSW